ncbi:MAG: DUF3179 domain-containing (seleno)protein [Gemmatimonadota bacterium]
MVAADGARRNRCSGITTGRDAERAAHLADDDPVIGLLVDDEPLAIPHSILWLHETENLDRGDLRPAITYCPLTGSSLALDGSAVGGGEFGVSGLLFDNSRLRLSGDELSARQLRVAERAAALPDGGDRRSTTTERARAGHAGR